ncbi:MAG TPA: hypothetical protein PLC90_13655 [Bacteroidales bacterium]|nr:hypothetical protein [Paludibacteraceae bacterium]HPI31213.1 hypothetical protein [Bacteroidales bacterium]HQN17385.1 hypothetical protein [Bacteroidales bacterium]
MTNQKRTDPWYKCIKYPCLFWHAYILIGLAIAGFISLATIIKPESGKEKLFLNPTGLFQIFMFSALILLLIAGITILFIIICRKTVYESNVIECNMQAGSSPPAKTNELSKEEKKEREDYEKERIHFSDYMKLVESAKVKTNKITEEGGKKVETNEEKTDTDILQKLIEKRIK